MSIGKIMLFFLLNIFLIQMFIDKSNIALLITIFIMAIISLGKKKNSSNLVMVTTHLLYPLAISVGYFILSANNCDPIIMNKFHISLLFTDPIIIVMFGLLMTIISRYIRKHQ